jgi:hypothetical protein
MKKTMVEVPVFVYTVENHEAVKPELLRLISDTPARPYITGNENIGRSDWFEPPHSPRPYYKKVMELLSPIVAEFQSEMRAEKVHWDNYWFQQYENSGEWHGWHVHPHTMYGMVYYVELPDGSPATTLRTDCGIVVPDVKEGDVLLFPSQLFHRSAPNQGSGRKTAVVMNLNFDEYAA